MKKQRNTHAVDEPWLKKEFKRQDRERKQVKRLLSVVVYNWGAFWTPRRGADSGNVTAKRFLLVFKGPVKYDKVMNVLARAFANENIERLS